MSVSSVFVKTPVHDGLSTTPLEYRIVQDLTTKSSEEPHEDPNEDLNKDAQMATVRSEEGNGYVTDGSYGYNKILKLVLPRCF